MCFFFAKVEQVNWFRLVLAHAKPLQKVNVQKPNCLIAKLEDYGLPLPRKINPCT